jgi:5-formyltetrahydrofolate cyclo-ligase
MEATAQNKVALRKQMSARLAGQSAADVRAKSAAIWERLSVVREFAGATRPLVYVSKAREVDTHGLIRQLLAMGRNVCVPWFDVARKRYAASGLRDFDADLTSGRFGILEPKPEAIRPATADQIDVALVPGLAFDETGNRLGRGLGYLDRLLQETSGARIALAFDFQLLGEVPTEAHDMRMDFIVTETRVIKTKGNRQ